MFQHTVYFYHRERVPSLLPHRVKSDLWRSLYVEFHRQREKHPERFASRMYNKSFYFKSFLSQIPSKSKYINNVITLKAENEQINLPNVQGLIFINIPSWSAGADIWKVDKDNERWDCQGNLWIAY